MQVRSILAKEGLRGLYAGYGAFLLRDLPFDAIEFVAYEQLRKAAATFLERDPNPGEVALVGAAAGGITGEGDSQGEGVPDLVLGKGGSAAKGGTDRRMLVHTQRNCTEV